MIDCSSSHPLVLPARPRLRRLAPNRRAALLRAVCSWGLLLPLLAPSPSPAQLAPGTAGAPISPSGAAPATRPAAPEAERPLLRELDRETRELYHELRGGVLRVQIPEPLWARAPVPVQDNWLTNKYKNLNPGVRQHLLDPQQQLENATTNSVSNSTNAPANPPGNNVQQSAGGNGANSAPNNSKESNGSNDHQDRPDRQGVTIIVPTNSLQAPSAPGPQQAPQTPPAPPGQPSPQAPQAPQGQQQLPERHLPPVERQNFDRQSSGTYGPQTQVQAGAGPTFSPNNIGLLLDDQGHVLVPQFVDREALGDQLIHLTGESGAVLDAKLVGSDQQTGLTILQLLRPAGSSPAGQDGRDGKAGEAKAPALPKAPVKESDKTESTKTEASKTEPTDDGKLVDGKPVRLAKSRPPDGSLVLLLSPGDGAGKLAVWSGGGRDYGVVVNIDGQVAGVTRFGQFLGGPACQLIADQIIRNGAVRRATLGVIITQIEKDDPQRAAQPLLGDRPAVRVDQVMQHSVADRGGLKQGDVLLSLDGEPITDIPTVAAAIAAKDGRARLKVLRGDQILVLTVDLQQK